MTYKTSIGLNENVVAALCYVGFWFTGILFLLIERQNKFVRFHAMQSVLVFMPLALIVFLMGWIPYFGWVLADLVGMFSLFLLLAFAVMAYEGGKFKVPLVGKYAYDSVYKEK
ncbi:hypothetical protein [uncultured Methanomethylovorans sp.]|uniref:DUF4870 domain-containing protein n=1 Tax=uncultured Methanomethylovorans sp. TaxID=183759 RepID=UPI002AA63ACF|nr:hypothetical protein [uncultured Methanomethylovorans sp.]